MKKWLILIALVLGANAAWAQTGTVMPDPLYAPMNDSGLPCANCKLYVYTAGTTTPATTYSEADLALAHANPNPVILSPTGRAAVYLTPSNSYRFDLKTAADVLIYSRDNVPATFSSGNLVAALSPFYYATVRSVSSAATLYCVQTGSNAADQILETTGAGSFTVTLDALANCATGRYFSIKARGTGTITIDPNAAETIDGAATYAISKQYTSITIYKSAGNEWSIQ